MEFDFRNLLHIGYRTLVESDLDEAFRQAKQILRNPGSRFAAAVAGWDQPLSIETFMLASLYTAWVGERHPLLPDVSEKTLSDAEIRLADKALESMNRR